MNLSGRLRLVPLPLPLLLLPLACSGPTPTRTGPPVWVWPGEPRPHRLEVTIDTLPARTALEYLDAAAEDPALLSAAVESAKSAGALRSFETDAEAFRAALVAARAKEGSSPLSGVASRSHALLSAITALEEVKDAAGTDAALRVARLLPDDPPVSMTYRVVLSLGIGRTASAEALPAEQGEGLALDPARTFSEREGGSKDALADRVASRVAPELWDRARDRSRMRRPAPPAEAGHRHRLVLDLFEIGPRRYLELSNAFLPLNRWLADPVRAAFRELAIETRRNPKDTEAGPADRIRPEDLSLAAAALVDGIAVTLGPDRARKALEKGPAELFAAWKEAVARNSDLVPLPEDLEKAAATLPREAATP